MAEVVLQMVALGLQCVEGLILDLPARPATGGEIGDRLFIDRQIGDEAVGVSHLASLVDDLDLKPVDVQCPMAVTERNILHPAVAVGNESAALFDFLLEGHCLDAMQPLIQAGM